MATKCSFCKVDLPGEPAFEVCKNCGLKIWGEKMYEAIRNNMEGAKQKGNLFQGSISDSR